MEFRILGTLEISADGVTVPLRAPQLRNLLAMLLVRPRELVSIDELVERLWEDEQYPANPSGTIHTYVRRLRAIVGADVLQTRERGYLLDAEPADLTAFRLLTAEAAATADPATRADVLRRALALWHGDPFGGVLSSWIRRNMVAALTEERLLACEDLADARLALGEHVALLPELSSLTAQHPLRERLRGQLMTALARAGRQAEALAAYDSFATRLAEDYGIDPGAQLVALRQAVLTGDIALRASGPRPAPIDGWEPQYQLPLDVQNMVGRDEQLRQIMKLVRDSDGVPVVILSGPPGIGKSALSVRAGHWLAERFGDGQWYVRLRGASDQPRDVDDVLLELIRLTGVDQRSIPDDHDSRAALLRSRLAGRRVLLVLDDARDARQVRSLLPGAAGNAVLVTSRSGLDSLVALEGAVGIRLDVLAPDASAELVSRLIGSTLDPAATAELVSLCGGLPLALRIAGANAAGSSGSLGDYVERMRTTGPLSMLAIAGDDESGVGTAFRTSYRLLGPEVQRGFRLLSAFPGAEFGAAAAVALIGPDGLSVLDRLERASLLQRPSVDRYQLHDLVREYGAQLAVGDPELGPAWESLCSWYVATADAATTALFQRAVRLPIEGQRPMVFDEPAALAWFDQELANIEAVARKALAEGPAEVVWQLADIARPYAYQNSLISEWRSLADLGLAAARATGNVLAEGAMMHAAGVLARISGHADSAIEHSKRAVELYAEGGFRTGEAALLSNLGLMYNDQGWLRLSSEALARGIELFRSEGETEKLPRALLNQSLNYIHLGNLRAAVSCVDELLAIDPGTEADSVVDIARVNRASAYRLLGDLERAAVDLAWPAASEHRLDHISRLLCIAIVEADLGHHDEAMKQAELGLRESVEFGSAYHEYFSLLHVADILMRGGEYARARAQYEEVSALAAPAGYQSITSAAGYGLAQCTFRLNRPTEALAEALLALEGLTATEYRLGICDTHLLLANCYTALNQPAEASTHATAAQQILTETGYVPPNLP